MTLGTAAPWLQEFAATAAKTDRFTGKADHTALLAAGLVPRGGYDTPTSGDGLLQDRLRRRTEPLPPQGPHELP